MMDLLIQVTTAHKINPAGHIIHVVSDSRLVTYKPSTPIGVWLCVRVCEINFSNTRVKYNNSDNSERQNTTRNLTCFPVGRLDSSVIQIVAKNKANEEARARRAHLVAQAVEKNIRLKVGHNKVRQNVILWKVGVRRDWRRYIVVLW